MKVRDGHKLDTEIFEGGGASKNVGRRHLAAKIFETVVTMLGMSGARSSSLFNYYSPNSVIPLIFPSLIVFSSARIQTNILKT